MDFIIWWFTPVFWLAVLMIGGVLLMNKMSDWAEERHRREGLPPPPPPPPGFNRESVRQWMRGSPTLRRRPPS